IGKSGKELVWQIRVEIADPSRANLDVVPEVRPPAQIDDNLRQGFVERTTRLAEAADAVLITQRNFKGLTQRQANVFHRVMKVDLEIAFGSNLNVKKTVAAKTIEHVIKERHAGFNGCLPGAVDIQLHHDVGFFCFP